MSAARAAFAAGLWLALGAVQPARGGGNLELVDITGRVPSPIPGQVLAEPRGYRWDDRCLPAGYRVNATLDPIPNGGGATQVSLATSIEAIQRAFATWNAIPTSYVEMGIIGTTLSPVTPGFDFVNEISFIWPAGVAASAYSPSTVLLEDAELRDGEDLDGDGDADVSGGIGACADVDGDGDHEFPAGFYAAGTILDNDMAFDPFYYWSPDGSHAVDYWRDLEGIALHELGHSHGLAHSSINQISPDDGTLATMHGAAYDEAEELSRRTLHDDDIAWSSFLYPEGSKAHGPGALQPGDIAFGERFAVIRGEVTNAQSRPVAGSLVFAQDAQGRVVSSVVAGRVRVSVDAGQLDGYYTPFALLPPQDGIVDGRYALPVPKGVYHVGVEANDGMPEYSLVNLTGLVGYLYGSQNFVEEFHSGPNEGISEHRLGAALPVQALRDREAVDIRLDDNQHILALNGWALGVGWVNVGPQGVLLAVRVPSAELLAVDRGRGLLLQAATYATAPIFGSEVSRFNAALITTGVVADDGAVRIDIERPLLEQSPFLGQDFDYMPLYAANARQLGRVVTELLPKTGKDLFVVLELSPDSLPGFPGLAKDGVVIEQIQPGDVDFGRSYYSYDRGVTWFPLIGYGIAFGLVVAPL